MIPVMICPPRPRGGLARYEHTSHSAPRRRRSWSAWMTCTGAGHAGRAAGVAAGHQTAPGRLAPGTVKHAPPRTDTCSVGNWSRKPARLVSVGLLDQRDAGDANLELVGGTASARPWPTVVDAAGNPSLVAELISGLREDHAVQVTGGRAVLLSARLPQRIHRLAQRRFDGLSQRARQLLVTASVLGPAFRLEDAAEMLGETPARLLPEVEEAMDAAIMTAAGHEFTFRHPLLRRAAVS